MKKNIIIIILLLSNYVLFPQEHFHCIIDEDRVDGPTNIVTNPKYGHIKSYIPNMDSTLPFHNPPIKTINVNINILQKDDGSGNFQDNEDTREMFRRIFEWINGFYSSYEPSDPIGWVEELPSYDSRIRFSIGEEGNERIYFYKNTNFWNPYIGSNGIYSYISNTYPERMNAINVYVFGNPADTLNMAYASYSYYTYNSNQTVKCYYWKPISEYSIANLLGHEFGHCLNLMHTYKGGGGTAICDIDDDEFIRDVFMLDTVTQECNCPHKVEWGADAYAVNGDRITNNLMGGNQSQRYISPLQAGVMHRSLSLTNVRKYVTCEKSNIPLTITENETWDFNIKLYRDLIIESGATLTLSDYLVMLPDAKIIIKPGGRLIVDGATITTDIHENQKWQGIQVWGVDSLLQQQVNGRYLQGYLELKNGAAIENAVCAVKLWNPSDDHSEGGIIHATDAIFRNNAKAIHACNYSNYNPTSGSETDYDASFNNCSFVIDSNYVGEELFLRHVELDNVNGFRFNGCSFSVDRDVPQVSLRPYGIVANNTGLSLSCYITEGELPLPGGNYTRNSFSGFESAIYVTNSSQYARTFSVEYTDFSDNVKGVLAQNTGYATIKDNSFSVGSDEDCSFGVYLDRVSFFDIEDNSFSGNDNYGGDNYGIMVRNSESYNDISGNFFMNLNIGNVAFGKNFANDIYGLTYTCNTNVGNVNDFCVFKENGIGGISPRQGSMLMPAGNTFSASNYHIYNAGDNTISYYYYTNDYSQRPISSKLYNVNVVGSSNASGCGTGNIPGMDVMNADDIVALENEYNATLAAYNNLLQAKSQNAQTSEDIEAQLAQLKTEYLDIVGEIVKFYLQQEETDCEELRQWLSKSEDIFADRMVVASFIQEGDYDDAKTYAEMIAKIYNLESDALKDHNDYLKLVDLYIDLHKTDRSTSQLTDAELTMVKSIADNGIGTSQMMAESVMMAAGEPSLKVPQCLTLPPALIISPQTRGVESSDFAPVGAKWYYDYDQFWTSGYLLIESVSDTVIDGFACKKLAKSKKHYNYVTEEVKQFVFGYEYMTQIDDSVMIYRYGKLRKLYDLNAEIGDTLTFPGSEHEPVQDSSLMYGRTVVVGKGTVEFDGQTLRYIDLKNYRNWEESPWQFTAYVDYGNDYYMSARICEKIGNISGYLLPEICYEADATESWGALRCYSDDAMSVSFSDEECDYVPSDVGIDETTASSINIYPNPANDNVTISLTGSYNSIEIYDSFGRMMMSQQVNTTTSQQVIDVDISSYTSGLYLVVIKSDDERHYKRIVKN